NILGLTITEGWRSATGNGAGILQDSGSLALNECAISDNFVGYGGGGGIYASGAVLATKCIFSGNNAYFPGGGIAVAGTFRAVNCTVFGNTSAHNHGGGIAVNGNLFVTNCTISGNFAGAGASGGGVFNDSGSATIRSTIIAGNIASQGLDCYGMFTSAGFNLIGYINDSSGWGALGDQVRPANSFLDPLLGPLQYNGGPTKTRAPQAGSPAIDQGNSSGSSTDQRGRTRPHANYSITSIPLGGDRSDIGAVELRPPLIYEWTFDHHDLSAALGPGLLTYADDATPGVTSFGTTDGATLPHIGGKPAAYMHVPAFTGLSNGYLVELTASDPNGGGQFINQYTFIADVLLPGSVNFMPFFNTNPQNQNDADFYIAPNGSVGIQVYSSPGLITSNTWYRIAFVADLALSRLIYFVNGLPVGTNNTPTLDGRWALFSEDNPGADLLLFNEGDLSGVYTHEVYVAHVAMIPRNLSASEIAILGGPVAEGIFARRLSVNRSGNSVVLNWRGAANVAVQKATSFTLANWQTIDATLGASNYNETATSAAFYRLTGP
ncbi:MAG: hypothetical protein M3Y82_11175, partial [Verrucomicrobiota bacterium]|nr:hypothetical protein [Verrucomicrobiota bacterium]